MSVWHISAYVTNYLLGRNREYTCKGQKLEQHRLIGDQRKPVEGAGEVWDCDREGAMRRDGEGDEIGGPLLNDPGSWGRSHSGRMAGLGWHQLVRIPWASWQVISLLLLRGVRGQWQQMICCYNILNNMNFLSEVLLGKKIALHYMQNKDRLNC